MGRTRSGAGATTAPRRRARRAWPLALLLLILLSGAWIRLTAISPPNRTPDERMYAGCCQGFHDFGPRFMGMLIQACWDGRARSPEYPFPTRIGYYGLVTAAMVLSGSTSVDVAAEVSTVASLAVFVLAAWLGLRYLGPWTTVLALLFLATSPLDLAIAGRAWQDEVVAFLALAMIHAYARSLEQPGRARWPILFFALGAYALTVKETAIIVLAAGTVGLLIAAWSSERRARTIAWTLGGSAIALGAAAAAVVIGSGGIEFARKSWELWKLVSVPNDYMRHYQMGGPRYYAIGLALLNAVPFALGLAAALALALRARFMRSGWTHPRAGALLASLAWLVISCGVVMCVASQKNMRFLSIIFVPIFLLASALVRAGMVALAPRIPARAYRVALVALALVLAASAVADVARFHQWFIVRGVPDLATPWFTAARG
jgi:4-amino-4-deoxy-L-arabinose transferase-like glycosyltransferase